MSGNAGTDLTMRAPTPSPVDRSDGCCDLRSGITTFTRRPYRRCTRGAQSSARAQTADPFRSTQLEHALELLRVYVAEPVESPSRRLLQRPSLDHTVVPDHGLETV